MSYILDALQRADAERARGGVPTLHDRPPATPPLHTRFGGQQHVGLALATTVLVVGLGAAGWWLWPATPSPAPAEPITPLPLPAAVSALPATQPKPPASTPQAPPATPRAPPATPRATASASALAAVPATTTLPKTKTMETVKVAAASTPPASPATKTALPPLLAELPEATRLQIPSLAITGAVYSENPAQRLLLVNGLVLGQGSQVAPDLTVVEIRANRSEFDFRGTRFRMAH